jgi:hypothetical protein
VAEAEEDEEMKKSQHALGQGRQHNNVPGRRWRRHQCRQCDTVDHPIQEAHNAEEVKAGGGTGAGGTG